MMLQNLHKITFASLWQLMTSTFVVNLQILVLKYLRTVRKLNPSFRVSKWINMQAMKGCILWNLGTHKCVQTKPASHCINCNTHPNSPFYWQPFLCFFPYYMPVWKVHKRKLIVLTDQYFLLCHTASNLSLTSSIDGGNGHDDYGHGSGSSYGSYTEKSNFICKSIIYLQRRKMTFYSVFITYFCFTAFMIPC